MARSLDRRGGRHAPLPTCRYPLAVQAVPDVICRQRGKGGGPTVCIDVGLARWLSASRRPADAQSVAYAAQCESSVRTWAGIARCWFAAPQGRRPANTRQTPNPRADRSVQPVPVWLALRSAERLCPSRCEPLRRMSRPSPGVPHERRPGVLFALPGAAPSRRQFSPAREPSSTPAHTPAQPASHQRRRARMTGNWHTISDI